jgi:NTP pyrophosphatase (non-canonical NTP hydrolase)
LTQVTRTQLDDIKALNAVFQEIQLELAHARAKFPTKSGELDMWMTLAALTEEVGELNKAMLERAQEPTKRVSAHHVREEAIQVATMAIRVILDTEACK